MQQDINLAFADAVTTKTKFEPNRNGLHGLALASGTVSEGDLAQLVAYITIARDEGKESVNCGRVDGKDIHLSLGPLNGGEFQGIVAEMIPQLPRPPGWNAATLMRISAAKLPVLVVGGLTYDNEHFVNKDAAHPKGGQPKRLALWELHPITEFYVCTTGTTCDPLHHEQWLTLADWANAHP